MTLKKQRVKLFQITGITANSINHASYKVPRDFIALQGIQAIAFINTGVGIRIQEPIGLLTLNLNDKAINPMQRYPLIGRQKNNFPVNRKKFLPISVNEELKAGSHIDASYQDLGKPFSGSYTVTVYLYGTVEKELIP